MFTIQFHPSGNRVLRFEAKDVALLLRMVKRTGDLEAENRWARMVSPVTGLAYIVNPAHPAAGDLCFVEDDAGEERTFKMGKGSFTAKVRWVEPEAADRDLNTNLRESRCIVAAIGHAATDDAGIVRPFWVTAGVCLMSLDALFDSARGIAAELEYPVSVVYFASVGEGKTNCTTRTFAPPGWTVEQRQQYNPKLEEIAKRVNDVKPSIMYEEAAAPLGGLAYSIGVLQHLFFNDIERIDKAKPKKADFEGDVLGGKE